MLVTIIFSFSHNVFRGFFFKVVKYWDFDEKGFKNPFTDLLTTDKNVVPMTKSVFFEKVQNIAGKWIKNGVNQH